MKPSKPSKVQGEGDYASAKKYNEQARAFAESGKAEQAARDAAPRNAQEEESMRKAEAEGRAHAKGWPGDGGTQPRRPKSENSQPENSQPVRPKQEEKKAPGKNPTGSNPMPKKLPGR